ncbi:MAG: hypothetical protein HY401_00035 [Elusimicrobia bacterium]|nr:hypothetical protein [Elusimicrobiota bacterium]
MKLKIFAIFAAAHLLVASVNLKVGFDYDDTLSFSTPAFDKAFAAETDGVKPFGQEFWQIVNKNYGLEEPKWGVIFWALLFKVAGFDVVIITARLPVDTEDLIAKWSWLHDGFYFTKEKARLMKNSHYAAFVGDSDSDMEESDKAGVIAIRARRSPKSSYKENYSPGKYGEWILPFSG